MNGSLPKICRVCGIAGAGKAFVNWVRPTFTNFDALVDGEIICDDCLFWFDEQSKRLAQHVGKEKPQRMRNYSHFVVGGKWTPLSKKNKSAMTAFLLDSPFPELAVIAQSGQKHIVFRARRNEPGGITGWLQFEEQSLHLRPDDLRQLLISVELLYRTFSKTEIKIGKYKAYRIKKFGFAEWQRLEYKIRLHRGSLLFSLVIFLAQKKEQDDTRTRNGGGIAMDNLAGDTNGLQKPLPADDLAAIRGQSEKRSIHKQAGDIRQLTLLEPAGDDRHERNK